MKTRPPEATKTVYPILRQIVNHIPPNIFPAAASTTKDLSRVFTPWSHAVALIYQWQIWTGLLVHLLLRFLKFLAKWNLSFSRVAGVVRAAVWVRRNVVRLLETYGTAGGWKSDAPKPNLRLWDANVSGLRTGGDRPCSYPTKIHLYLYKISRRLSPANPSPNVQVCKCANGQCAVVSDKCQYTS